MTREVNAASFVAGTFFSLLAEREREAIALLGIVRRFPASAVLMFEKEPSERVMVILSGRVKVWLSRGDGQEVLLTIRDPGDLIGELGFVDGGPRLATVSALEPVTALVVPGPAFRAHLAATPGVAVALLQVITQRLRDTTVKRSQFADSDTLGRVAARILELSDRYGIRAGAEVEVVTPLSQEELAAWTGASRTGVAQALQVMRQLGWIRTERRRIIVADLAALRARGAREDT